jgi:hypothetical protein
MLRSRDEQDYKPRDIDALIRSRMANVLQKN